MKGWCLEGVKEWGEGVKVKTWVVRGKILKKNLSCLSGVKGAISNSPHK
jgi:hypothetical protein